MENRIKHYTSDLYYKMKPLDVLIIFQNKLKGQWIKDKVLTDVFFKIYVFIENDQF